MKKAAFIALSFLCVVTAKLYYDLGEAEYHFGEFMRTYNKQYKDEDEMLKRYEIFVKNLEKANKLNEMSEHAEFGITEFSDLTVEEFIHSKTCYREGVNRTCPAQEFKSTNYPAVPTEFDWRSKGVVSEVKEQGDCGSCWAFSVIGNVESLNTIKTKQKIILSEQQLVDCDGNSYGCDGGLPESGFGYLIKNGVISESDYPYEAEDNECRYQGKSIAVKISKCISITVKEDQLPERLYQTAPLSIAIDGSKLHLYRGGIIHDEYSCSGHEINHAVLLVGYGIDNGLPYWLIKNSWGTRFGEKGYFKAKRGVNCLSMMNTAALTGVM